MTHEIDMSSQEHSLVIKTEGLQLKAILGLPEQAAGIVVFAHGSGSGRLSPRNNYVAHILQKANLATLLLDLLTESEELDRTNVFDIELLSDRLILAKKWLSQQRMTKSLKVGYFGASTGAGAALMAAAQEPTNIEAIVSRGGRPDLAGKFLNQIEVPTLLIVGGDDDVVIELNQMAYQELSGEKEIKIIPGATHLFEEPGKLEEVARLASAWFQKYLLHPEIQKQETRPQAHI